MTVTLKIVSALFAETEEGSRHLNKAAGVTSLNSITCLHNIFSQFQKSLLGMRISQRTPREEFIDRPNDMKLGFMDVVVFTDCLSRMVV
jgi:hypothetical protein